MSATVTPSTTAKSTTESTLPLSILLYANTYEPMQFDLETRRLQISNADRKAEKRSDTARISALSEITAPTTGTRIKPLSSGSARLGGATTLGHGSGQRPRSRSAEWVRSDSVEQVW